MAATQKIPNDHYERAVQDFLRSHDVPYLRVDQIKRSAFAGVKLKSFDLLIYPEQGRNILADIKGRKWPYRVGRTRKYWENWVTADDLQGLTRWQEVFGEEFRSAFIFSYWLTEAEDIPTGQGLHTFDGQKYGFLLVWLSDYTHNMRVRSARWRTLSMPTEPFKALAKPLEDVLWTKTPA